MRRVRSDVVLRREHHACLADPAGVGAQETQVVVDGRGLETALDPPCHHDRDMPVCELARVQVVELGVPAQLTKERRQEALSVEHGVKGHTLVLRRVLVIELLEQRTNHADVVPRAHRKPREDRVGVFRRTGRRAALMGSAALNLLR